jgi:H+-transporting ATPase
MINSSQPDLAPRAASAAPNAPPASARGARAPAEGLTSAEAAERLQRVGPNTVAQMRPRTLGALLKKFWGLIPWMLELAIIIDVLLGRWLEASVIAALLIFNALLGFFQENRAQQALALLRQRLTVTARVRRDGAWQTLPATQLVPDDLARVRVGDIAPADLRLSEGHVQVDESQLTGESLPVEREPAGMVYAGSLIRRGEATGVVTATGAHTYFGKTAELVRLAAAPRRLEHVILTITRFLAALVISLALAVLAATLFRGLSFLNMLPFGLMLLVAAVPVALPAMFTMSAALGARGLAEKGILATRLSAVEDAAAMDVLCLDKTGTLTENRLTVQQVEARAHATTDEVLRLGALASDEATQDALDLAILQAARDKGALDGRPERFDVTPFDPTTRRSEASFRQGEQVVRVVKGEPRVIADLLALPWSLLEADVTRLSANGARVLAVASGPASQLQLAGLIALADPPRADSPQLIDALRQRGVRVVLATGDGEATARAVAAQVGIRGEVAPAGVLREGLDPAQVARYTIFARVYPEEKFRLVQALQNAGHVVGMTGDGVNDAPALRQADVGIAVAHATDVAKAAASLVLTRPGLGEIAMAVDGSRRMYQRMQTFIVTMVTRKLAIPLFLSLGVILLGKFVVNPLLIVLMMFATDGATMAVSTDQAEPSRSPDRWAMRPVAQTAAALATLLLLLSGVVVWLALGAWGLSIPAMQTTVFVWLVFAGTQAVLYVTRGRGFFWERPYPGRWLLLATLIDLVVVATMAAFGWLMAPISVLIIAELLGLALVYLFTASLLKVAMIRGAARSGANNATSGSATPGSPTTRSAAPAS